MNFQLSEKMYKIMKWAVMIVMPAIAAFYAALSTVWSLPYSEEVTATVSALVMFLGAFLSMSSSQFYIAKALATPVDEVPVEFPFPMSGEVYDTLKWVAQVALPAFSTAYLAMAQIWNWPFPEAISATAMALVVFLSTVLQIVSARFSQVKQEVFNSN